MLKKTWQYIQKKYKALFSQRTSPASKAKTARFEDPDLEHRPTNPYLAYEVERWEHTGGRDRQMPLNDFEANMQYRIMELKEANRRRKRGNS